MANFEIPHTTLICQNKQHFYNNTFLTQERPALFDITEKHKRSALVFGKDLLFFLFVIYAVFQFPLQFNVHTAAPFGTSKLCLLAQVQIVTPGWQKEVIFAECSCAILFVQTLATKGHQAAACRQRQFFTSFLPSKSPNL